jgi:predicted nucleic acid-binding protein
MTFADLAAGATFFLDTNIIVYAFAPDPTFGPSCFDLIERVRRSEISAVLTMSCRRESLAASTVY